MTQMITKSLNKLFLVLSIIVLTAFIVGSSVVMADSDSKGKSNRTVRAMLSGLEPRAQMH